MLKFQDLDDKSATNNIFPHHWGKVERHTLESYTYNSCLILRVHCIISQKKQRQFLAYRKDILIQYDHK